MAENFSERVREEQRLILLQHLQAQNEYSSHEHLLREALAQLGQRISADALRAQLAWLEEQGLVMLAGEHIQVATLTLRGSDVATGATRVPGVARPRPGERC